MKTQATLDLERRARWYVQKARNGATDCINSRVKYELECVDYENKTLTLRFKTEDWMMNPGGVLHGGMMSTILDITMGITSATLSEFYCSTINMSVSFLAAAPNNDELLVTARATRVGRTFVQLVAEAVSQQTGEICATSTGIFYLSKNKLVVPEEN